MSDFKLIKFAPDAAANNAKHLDKPLINRLRFIAPNPAFPDLLRKMKTDETLRRYYAGFPDRLAQQRFTTAIDARLYMGASAAAQTVYCSVWINPRKRDTQASGYATAGGYGYHKESEALYGALSAAGFTFSKGWGGSGDSSMTLALTLCGAKIGYRAGGLI
jgi:hypothetical protein